MPITPLLNSKWQRNIIGYLVIDNKTLDMEFSTLKNEQMPIVRNQTCFDKLKHKKVELTLIILK